MKKTRALLLTLAALLLGLMASLPEADAATTTANLNVSITVDSACTVSASNLTFADYAPLGSNLTNPQNGNSTVTLTCTAGATAEISMGVGQHASGAQRRMAQGASNFINYDVYQDSSRTVAWGSGLSAVTTTPAPDTTPRQYVAYAQVPAAQSAPSGAYTDVVLVSVNY